MKKLGDLVVVESKIQDELGIYFEPHTFGDEVSMLIFVNNIKAVITYDYESFNSKELEIALTSKTEKEFERKFKQFLESIIREVIED